MYKLCEYYSDTMRARRVSTCTSCVQSIPTKSNSIQLNPGSHSIMVYSPIHMMCTPISGLPNLLIGLPYVTNTKTLWYIIHQAPKAMAIAHLGRSRPAGNKAVYVIFSVSDSIYDEYTWRLWYNYYNIIYGDSR